MNRNNENDLPKIHYFHEVTSCLDVAFRLVKDGRLDEWDSVQAGSQTAGRGQMRRKWVSPAGNLYAAIRLPMTPPFNNTAAAIAVSSLCANALRSFGLPVFLKWPNDIVLSRDGQLGKAGGILMEEKEGILLAGIGVNILVQPRLEDMRSGATMPPITLKPADSRDDMPEPAELCRALVKHIHSVYKNAPDFAEIWKNLADHLLLWRGEQVEISDGGQGVRGEFLGMADSGAAIVSTPSGTVEKYNGEMFRL